MPNRKFLEKYPLYRKFRMNIPDVVNYAQIMRNTGPVEAELDKPAVHMPCDICDSEQTFNMINNWSYDAFPHVLSVAPESSSSSPSIMVARLIYRCTSCDEFLRYFLVKFDRENNYVMKVGQDPSWDISLDPL